MIVGVQLPIAFCTFGLASSPCLLEGGTAAGKLYHSPNVISPKGEIKARIPAGGPGGPPRPE